ncbi:GDSL-type esterase/lipase family protein [Rubritalea tangerina]|uniref:GDSL-type esterase/lipase family protein n=2 Tax=Rubritalea tangerina TaxID=430798 RepID=A0ABW4Z823_9BACT
MMVSAQKVVCVGDSNTQRGYPAMLEKQLGEGWETLNCGKGGATLLSGTRTPYFGTHQYQALLKSEPDVVVIMLGTNDANPLWWKGKRATQFVGSSAEELISQYQKLIGEVRSLATKPKVYVVTPPPVFPDRAKGEKVTMRAARKELLETEVLPLIRKVAREEEVILIDVHGRMLGQEQLSSDGVHFTKKGYELLTSIIKEGLLQR